MCGKCSNYSDDEFHVCLMLILSCAMISVSSEFLDTDIYRHFGLAYVTNIVKIGVSN